MSKKKKEPIVPKTQPTGKPPSNAVRPPPVVEVLAATKAQSLKAWRVKVVYMQERGRWETLKSGRVVKYQPPASYDGRVAVTIEGEVELEAMKASVWQKLVDWCRARKIPPEPYIRHCFQFVPLKYDKAPEPAQLMTATKYQKLWKDNKHKRREEIRLALEIQKKIARRHLIVRQTVHEQTPEIAQIVVLSNREALGLSPLFCYCLAVSINTKKLNRIARRTKAMAILQFESSRSLYKKVWAEMLPHGFAAESKMLYPYLLAKLWASRKTEAPSDD